MYIATDSPANESSSNQVNMCYRCFVSFSMQGTYFLSLYKTIYSVLFSQPTKHGNMKILVVHGGNCVR